MRVFIETHGCQMNDAESSAMENRFQELGSEIIDDETKSDVIIINTCAVRESAEERIFGRLGYFGKIKKENGARIILTGCMADHIRDEIKKKYPQVDDVILTNDKLLIPDFVMGAVYEERKEYSFTNSYYVEGEPISYIPIMNGCNNFCSYCIVPYVRGREISRDVDDVLAEVIELDLKGVKQITLLGQNVNSYRGRKGDEIYDFPRLLEEIIPLLKNIRLVYFESPHPKDFSDHLIDLIKNEERVAKHIHLPFQSGSSRILRLMNRRTEREDIIKLVEKMKSRIPSITFSVDVMTGFPTENEEEFLETLSMMDIINPVEAFMYFYNPREGTRAYHMEGQIPELVKKERLERLITLQLERQRRIKEEMLPFKGIAMVKGISRDDDKMLLAKDEHNFHISFTPLTPHKSGDIIKVEVDSLKGNTFRGREIE